MVGDAQERIELIELAVPGVSALPEGFFSIGRHYGSLSMGKLRRVQGTCGGSYVLVDAQGGPVGRGTAQALYVQCQQCQLSFPFCQGNLWSALSEWRKWVFASVLYKLLYLTPSLLPMRSSVWRELGPFTAAKEVLVVDGPNFESAAHLPYWPAYRVAVVSVAGFDKVSQEGQVLILTAGQLLSEMEESFQNRIHELSQRAASASESFHPKTRRYT